MHLSREMRRFEMDDLSSRRGDRKRYATQQMMTTIPTQSEIDDFVAACPKNVPHSFVDFHRKHGAVKMDIESIGSGLVWMWPLRDVLRFSHEYGFDEFAPGLLGFGTDGCGELYAIDVRENGTGAVGDIPATSLQWEDFRELSASFDAFADKLMAGTPIIEPDDVDASSQ
jgi:hypothetical protein